MRILLRGLLILLILAAGLWFGARHEAPSKAAPAVLAADSSEARGAAAFVGEDFGGLSMAALESHALPWKLVTAALVLNEGDAAATSVNDILARYGFLVDAQVANLPVGVADRPNALPLGITHGTISPIAGAPVQIANLGCAACHAGVTYDARGIPDPKTAWIGMPNTSVNLEAYTLAVFRALKAQESTPDMLMDQVTALYPETGWRERQTLRWLVLPLVRDRLNKITEDRPLPFPNGVPGATNGVAALKYALGVPLAGGGPADAGIVSIPDLSYRHWRNGLLVDAAYSVPDLPQQVPTTAADDTPTKRAELAAITTFFTVPTMGVHPDAAPDLLPAAEDIFAFLGDNYAPQPFPGEVNAAMALEGRAIYEAECSTCHGNYAIEQGTPRLTSFPNWIGEIGTDPLRAQALSDGLVAAIRTTPFNTRISVNVSDGAYAAPPLGGVWASAPYLHNGSVPSIWALLTPEARPKVFELGGHMLDFDRLGIALDGGRYPTTYAPFSTPALFDTRLPGYSNAGHLFGTQLQDAEKEALIAFLKQL
ncbi:hypothetical protein MWU60_11560 [Yoonia sp. F2084L]|uniref:c-type cytochrome n=1 Tax=Yoonia sp. F2084L TaxID=2926419 RepID=UPI001FF3A747|nr:hypothetical protein [Yoonia sp. F2084L]MCK0096210.1 hypothetical protein [Yoonia sp. F2084L]